MPPPASVIESTPEIHLQNISVTFDTVHALDSVDVILRPGERHAVVGENGAGKSTLMRVLFGLQAPTVGSIRLNGNEVPFSSPATAIAQGIGMVQQHFELIDAFTVAENILLGAESAACRGFRFDRKFATAIVKDLSEKSGLLVDPTARVGSLSVAARQRVEILKVLYRNARVLILDEPTAVLSPLEAMELWIAVRRLSQNGTTVVFVTHKLDDVMANADTVTVLRNGKRILSTPIGATDAKTLAIAMVGSSPLPESNTTIPQTVPRVTTSDPILRLDHVTVPNPNGIAFLQGATFTIHEGEIVGVAGVDGSGQTELLEAIIGLRPTSGGTLFLSDMEITHYSITVRKQQGIAYIPADRHEQAIVLPMSCEENAVLGQHRSTTFTTVRQFLRPKAIQTFLKDRSAAFDIRGAGAGIPMRALSGGNQQKLVLARELARKPRLLIAAQPTRGLDFAATDFVHRTLRRERERGCAILLQSLDLEEILALSDRVIVVRDGNIAVILNRSESSIERIGAAMTGAKQKVTTA